MAFVFAGLVDGRQKKAFDSGHVSTYAPPAFTSYGMPPRASFSQTVSASYDSAALAPYTVRENMKPAGVSVPAPPTSHFMCALRG